MQHALLALIITSTLTAPVLAQPTQPADPIAAAKWMIGEWRIETKWSNGNPLRARATYAPQMDGKFILVTSYTDDNMGGEAQRQLAVLSARDGKLVQWNFADDGSVRVDEATPTDDGSILFEWTKPATQTKAAQPLRQRITPTGPDSYRWQTFMQIKGEWHTLIDGEWKREEK